MKWFRLYTEIKDDPKMKNITDSQFRTLIYLMCIASEQECNGALNYPEKELSWAIRRTQTQVNSTIKTLSGLKILGPLENSWTFLNWNKRQFVSDNETENKRKQREKTKIVPTASKQCPTDVLPPEQNRADTETEQIHKKIKDKAADKTPQPVSRAVEAYREVYLRYPNKRYWPGIDDKISSESDHAIEKWKAILKEAVLNPKISIGTALDWYENGVTEWRGGKLVRREPELPPMRP